MYLAIRDNFPLFIVETMEEVFERLEIVITDTGVVKVGEVEDTITYNVKEFTKEEIFRDLKRTRIETLSRMAKVGLFELKRIG